ncbi:Os03g0293850, partial [Oryza sativa Japonica Group]
LSSANCDLLTQGRMERSGSCLKSCRDRSPGYRAASRNVNHGNLHSPSFGSYVPPTIEYYFFSSTSLFIQGKIENII